MSEKPAPTLTYLGHACVLIEAEGGERCVIDPYGSGGLDGKIKLSPLEMRADYVVTTHDHEDHSAIGEVSGKPTRIDEGAAGPFEVHRWPAWHDEAGGRRFGGAVDVVAIDVGECRILHLSDVGHAPPTDRPAAWLGAEVCLMPVGGCYTIGPAQAVEWWEQLRPKQTVPIHYGSDAIDLPLVPRDSFLRRCPGSVVDVGSESRSKLSVEPGAPSGWAVTPLEPVYGNEPR